MKNINEENFVVAAEVFFPECDNPKKELEELIFGKIENGVYVRGYGADLIDTLVEYSIDKPIITQEEFYSAYYDWWNNFASSISNLLELAENSYKLKQGK